MAKKPRPKITMTFMFRDGSKFIDYAETVNQLDSSDGVVGLTYIDYKTRDRWHHLIPIDQIEEIQICEPRAAWEGK